jgi:SOS-response transcriptional repressor LexA
MDGDLVIIDPSVKPRPGDFVVAKLANEDEATFKKYRPRGSNPDGGEIFDLVPLNEDYHTIRVDQDRPGFVVGVMMEHRRRRRIR